MERKEALPRSGVPIHIANRVEIPQYICGGELSLPIYLFVILLFWGGGGGVENRLGHACLFMSKINSLFDIFYRLWSKK